MATVFLSFAVAWIYCVIGINVAGFAYSKNPGLIGQQLMSIILLTWPLVLIRFVFESVRGRLQK